MSSFESPLSPTPDASPPTPPPEVRPGGPTEPPSTADRLPPVARPAAAAAPPDPDPLLTSADDADALTGLAAWGRPRSGRRPAGQHLAAPDAKAAALTPEQRLWLLDTWQRSGLPAGDFAALVGLSRYTL